MKKILFYFETSSHFKTISLAQRWRWGVLGKLMKIFLLLGVNQRRILSGNLLYSFLRISRIFLGTPLLILLYPRFTLPIFDPSWSYHGGKYLMAVMTSWFIFHFKPTASTFRHWNPLSHLCPGRFSPNKIIPLLFSVRQQDFKSRKYNIKQIAVCWDKRTKNNTIDF